MAIHLGDSVQFLKGVGPARALDLAKLGVQTVRDLLLTFPRNLSDRSNITSIADAPVGEEVVIMASPLSARERKLRGRIRSIVTVELSDNTGVMQAVWFNSPWVLEKFAGGQIMLFGKTKLDQGVLKMDHPQYEIIDGDLPDNSLTAGRIVPIYPCTGKLSQNIWRKIIMKALESCLHELEELYPVDFLQEKNFPDRQTAVRNMHFPENAEARDAAFARLVYDECLLMQLAICKKRLQYGSVVRGRRFNWNEEIDQRIRSLFPYNMTPAQDRCVKEIAGDMQADTPMHRLLQGDVGSGKTAVAIYSMLFAVANKAQVCLMAPTSLLARQHENTITDFLSRSKHSRVSCALLVGGASQKQRDIVKARLSSGALDILIATHSAIQDDIIFKDLGLVIIDEQHKFGVSQRAALTAKGENPDVLVMTATPIPRSLALTVYGDLEVSTIDELPPGRKPVKTTVTQSSNTPALWKFVRREVAKGRQAYIVSPLVDESEELDVKSATEAFEELSNGPLRELRLALLHGRMKREEQDVIMADFRSGKIDVLISTVVIEVGVDIPNANIMAVLHSERFGLAQLHQLRGRIGRGANSGHFILVSDSIGNNVAERRLNTLAETSDGFKIAEEDLSIRGPGEFLGTRQHGLPELKLVDIVRDLSIIRQARKDAENILNSDPGLKIGEHINLQRELKTLTEGLENEVGLG